MTAHIVIDDSGWSVSGSVFPSRKLDPVLPVRLSFDNTYFRNS